ncbi:MAG: hypothetical protein JKX75_07560 [Gammaproteobacteria bacterium]|nr:hypothetical protein [Gammaproteobacteria bacterium]
MKANKLKKGRVISQDNKNVLHRNILSQSPFSHSVSTLYKITNGDIRSGKKLEHIKIL